MVLLVKEQPSILFRFTAVLQLKVMPHNYALMSYGGLTMALRKFDQLTALMALLGIASSTSLAGASEPAKTQGGSDSMKVSETKAGAKKGADSACGKGTCGKDTKGAAAAKSKHSKAKQPANSATAKTSK